MLVADRHSILLLAAELLPEERRWAPWRELRLSMPPSRSHTTRIDVIPHLHAQVNGSWSSL
jgi:hypothetical protein